MFGKKVSVPPPRWKRISNITITLLVLILINAPFKLDFAQTLAFWSGLFRWGIIQTLSIHQIIKPILAIGLSFFIDVMQLPAKDELGLLRLSKPVKVFLLTAGLLLLFLSTRQAAVAPFIYQEF
jgi:hypothetical protein